MVGKAIDDVADELDPDYHSSGLTDSIFIANTDYEWVHPDKDMEVAVKISDEESKSPDGASIEMKTIYSEPPEPSVPMQP
jgi:hypothetical protein